MTTTDPNDTRKSRRKFATIIGSIILIPAPIRRAVLGGFFLALLAVEIALAETHHFWAMLSVAGVLILMALALLKIWW